MELEPEQWRKIADVLADMGQVIFASLAIPFFLDEYRPALAGLGMMLAVGFWIGSVRVAKLSL